MRLPNSTQSATLKEIARQLNVSISTVSRALNNSTEISSATRQRVLSLAQQLDYMPNPLALSLLNSRSHTVGVLVPEIANPFFSLVISGVEEVAYTHGYNVMIYQSHESAERERLNIRHIHNRRADGLIVSVSLETTEGDHFEQLQKRGFPMVFFDRVLDDLNADKVLVDDFEGAYRATQHLIAQGCQHIAHLAGPDSLAIGRKRRYGYLAALADNGFTAPPEYIVTGNLTTEGGLRQAARLLDLPQRPDGIFAANDRMALGLHKAIRERGLNMPNDIALIGFTDLTVATLLDPPLSSMAQPAFEMGATAARLLIAQLERPAGADVPPTTSVLKTNLIIRGSSARR
jgi:LacI family transcriptional regulator